MIVDLETMLESMKDDSIILQYSLITGEWHVTFPDLTDDVYSGGTPYQAVRSAWLAWLKMGRK